MKRHSFLSMVIASAAVALTVAGCGSSASDKTTPAGSTGSAVSGGTKTDGAKTGSNADPMAYGSLPMDAYMMTDAKDQKVVQQAFAITIHSCMKRFGFDYTPPAPDGQNQQPRHTGFGIDDPKQAGVWGYHAPQTAPPAPQINIGDENAEKNSPRQLVLTGGTKSAGGLSVPAGGCKGEAESKIEGDYSSVDMSLLSGPRGADKSDHSPAGPAGRDPKVQAALTAWSDCMKGQGYSFSTPDQAVLAFLKGPGTSSQPSATEITTAVADATCKQRTNLNGIWLAAEADLENKFIEQHAAALAQIKQQREDEVKRAAAIVGAGS